MLPLDTALDLLSASLLMLPLNTALDHQRLWQLALSKTIRPTQSHSQFKFSGPDLTSSTACTTTVWHRHKAKKKTDKWQHREGQTSDTVQTLIRDGRKKQVTNLSGASIIRVLQQLLEDGGIT